MPSPHRLSVRISLSHSPYRVAVAVREQPLTAADTPHVHGGVRGWFPWWAVVAPWLLSRVPGTLAAVDASAAPVRGGSKL